MREGREAIKKCFSGALVLISFDNNESFFPLPSGKKISQMDIEHLTILMALGD